MKKTILEEMLGTEHEKGTEPHPIEGVVVGQLVGLGPSGEPMVDFPGNPAESPLPANSTVRFLAENVGCAVALLFEDGDATRPLLIGPLVMPEKPTSFEIDTDTAEQKSPTLNASIDGEIVTITAENEIVLRCGKAKIVLKKDGKILVKGTDVMSRSEGPNRLKGASIQIN